MLFCILLSEMNHRCHKRCGLERTQDVDKTEEWYFLRIALSSSNEKVKLKKFQKYVE